MGFMNRVTRFRRTHATNSLPLTGISTRCRRHSLRSNKLHDYQKQVYSLSYRTENQVKNNCIRESSEPVNPVAVADGLPVGGQLATSSSMPRKPPQTSPDHPDRLRGRNCRALILEGGRFRRNRATVVRDSSSLPSHSDDAQTASCSLMSARSLLESAQTLANQ